MHSFRLTKTKCYLYEIRQNVQPNRNIVFKGDKNQYGGIGASLKVSINKQNQINKYVGIKHQHFIRNPDTHQN